MIKSKQFNYGQWTVDLSLHVIDSPRFTDVYVTIYCVGTWTSVNGSMWEDWECAKYDSPELLSDKLKERIIKVARKMMNSYWKE